MKNQFFGDINDYRKYGLLRILCRSSDIKLAICWMLTPPENDSSHGKKINYLSDPEKYRKFDPELYDSLKNLDILGGKDRHVSRAKTLFPDNCFFYEEILTDNLYSRNKYFNEFFKASNIFNMIFFDPDVGMAGSARKKGRKDSSRYLFWDELEKAFNIGHSILIYQHFHREERKLFINKKVGEFRSRIGPKKIWSFKTDNVVFFLLAQKHHLDIFSKQSEIVSRNWQGPIEQELHDATTLTPTSLPEKPPHSPASPPEQSISADKLDAWRRCIIRLVLQLEPEDPSLKGLVARIRRLSQQELVPRDIAALMVAVVEARNLAVWKGKVPVGLSAEAVRKSWEAVLQWARKQGLDPEQTS